MKQYLDILETVLTKGKEKTDRTGVGTISYSEGIQFKHDLSEGYPLLTTKRINWKNIVCELLFFLNGETNNKWLQERGCEIWTPWAPPNGELGRIYSYQWRNWSADTPEGSFDQIANLINNLTNDPFSRRHVVTAWNPLDFAQGLAALPACHYSWQCIVDPPIYLNMHVNLRSNDLFLGNPYNLASYALLCHLIAKQVNLTPKMLIINIADAHIYKNTIEQAKLQLTREPKQLPELIITDPLDLITMTCPTKEYTAGDYETTIYPECLLDIFHFGSIVIGDLGWPRLKSCWDGPTGEEGDNNWQFVQMNGYNPHPFIKAPVAV